jgi:hypothetical protein
VSGSELAQRVLCNQSLADRPADGMVAFDGGDPIGDGAKRPLEVAYDRFR